MHIQPYLFFDGRCEEALDFYKRVLGAEIGMLMRFKDNPETIAPGVMAPDTGNKVMHASFRIGDTVVMASDGYAKGNPKFEGVTLSLSVANEQEADRCFAALSEGGNVRTPIAKTFFSPRFGMVDDKFGVRWMVTVEPASADTARQEKPLGPVFEITRTFDASRAAVWSAHSEVERLRRWWGPKGCKLDVEALDFRSSGHFHYRMQFSNGPTMWGRFIYREIRQPERIVWINSFSDEHGGITRAPFPGAWPMEMLNTMTLTEQGGKTTLHLRSVPLGASPEECAFFEGAFNSLRQGFGGNLRPTRGLSEDGVVIRHNGACLRRRGL